MTIRRAVAIVATVVAVAALAGAAVAYANADDEPQADAAAEHSEHPASHQQATDDGPDGAAGHRGHHEHPQLAPYDERYAAASDDERAAADQLRADVAETLKAYTDVDAAVAAGFRPPRQPRGATRHYLNPTLVQDDKVLDPSQPEGLVYYTVEGKDPVLIGAFFVAPPGTEAPRPAGDLVVWHSHSPDCAAFFATADEPCTDTRRMVHVWTFDTLTLTGRRGRSAEVRLVDPFGAPLIASVERVGGSGGSG